MVDGYIEPNTLRGIAGQVIQYQFAGGTPLLSIGAGTYKIKSMNGIHHKWEGQESMSERVFIDGGYYSVVTRWWNPKPVHPNFHSYELAIAKSFMGIQRPTVDMLFYQDAVVTSDHYVTIQGNYPNIKDKGLIPVFVGGKQVGTVKRKYLKGKSLYHTLSLSGCSNAPDFDYFGRLGRSSHFSMARWRSWNVGK